MFDLIVTPVTNQILMLMKLYDQLKNELNLDLENNTSLTFINNGSTDGLHQRSFHTHDRIHYIGSQHKTKDLILLNHALIRQNPEYTENQWVLLLQPNTEIPKNYFNLVESTIKSNSDVDVILGRVDHKIKNKVRLDKRIKLYEQFTTERNSPELLKNFPPVPGKTQKINEKATDSQTFATKQEKKTETEIPTQNISADFSSRSVEPSDAQYFQRAESILSAQVDDAKIPQESTGDVKCRAVMSDKICQCVKCVEKYTIKKFYSDKKDTVKKVNSKSFNSKKVNGVSNEALKDKSARLESSCGDFRPTVSAFNIPRQNIHKFYSPNNILLKKDAIFKMGLFDIDFNFNQSMEILIRKMINLQDAAVVYVDDFPVINTGKVRKYHSNKEMLKKVDNYDFVYKDYIDKNVWRVYKTATEGVEVPVEDTVSQAVAISALVIVGSKQNEELITLTEKQLSLGDKLVVTELPDNCSKKLLEIMASNHVEQYSCVIIVNPNTKFRYPHFIDDFKRYSSLMDWAGVLVSDRDFDVREITPSLAVESDVSACFNSWNVFSPNVKEASTLSEFLQKCSDVIDATGRGLVSSFLPKPISKVPVMFSEKGEGGEVTPPVEVKHKSSWYDWME